VDGTPVGGWYPEERLNLEEAVRAYTLGPAHACGRAHQLGTLATGKLADLTVLDRDVRSAPAEEIPEIRVRMTLVGGQITYER
jgi:predicted amidohydrolase YtcJ